MRHQHFENRLFLPLLGEPSEDRNRAETCVCGRERAHPVQRQVEGKSRCELLGPDRYLTLNFQLGRPAPEKLHCRYTMIVPGFGTDWVCSLFWAGAMSLAWPTHFNANIVPIVSKPFFIVFASAAVWSISWIIPKNSETSSRSVKMARPTAFCRDFS
jgi:hypothetical protein